MHYRGGPRLAILAYFHPLYMSSLHTHTHKYNNQWGGTALYLAVREGHEDIVELLLQANADPDLQLKVIHTNHTCMLLFVTHELFQTQINSIMYSVYKTCSLSLMIMIIFVKWM